MKVALMEEVTCFKTRVNAEDSEVEPMEAPTQQRWHRRLRELQEVIYFLRWTKL